MTRFTGKPVHYRIEPRVPAWELAVMMLVAFAIGFGVAL